MAKAMHRKLSAAQLANLKSQAKMAQTRWTSAKTRGNSIVKMDDPIGTATVTCGALNVRQGPGTNYARIGGLTNGKAISVYADEGEWIKIGYGTGYGYVCKKYTTYQGTVTTEPTTPEPTTPEPTTPEPTTPEPTTPEPTTPEPTTPTTFDVKITANSGLNVRTGPGTDNGKLGLLVYGTVVTVTGEQDGWYKIDYSGSTGWICADYTEKVEPTTPEPTTPEPTTPEPTTSDKTVVTTDYLNLRQSPVDGKVLLTMPPGTQLTVLAEDNGWYQVNYKGTTGWCCASYTIVFDPSQMTGVGQDAANLAAKYEGMKTKDLLGTLPYLEDMSWYEPSNNGYDLNCANFATAILQQTGLLHSHSNTVSGAAECARNEGYHKSSKANAKPGDLWINGTQHAELVYSNVGGTVTLIGSNNKGGGDVQYVTKDSWSPDNYSNADYYSCQ